MTEQQGQIFLVTWEEKSKGYHSAQAAKVQNGPWCWEFGLQPWNWWPWVNTFLSLWVAALFSYPWELLFSRSVVSNSLWPHGLQNPRLPCPSPTPGACLNSCPLCWWCHPTISSSVIPFSSCLQSFPASGSFAMSQFFASGGQSIGASASASVLPMTIQDWFPLRLTGLISLQSRGFSRVFFNSTVQKHQFFGAQLSLS